MVSANPRTSVLPEFFRIEGAAVVEESLEDDTLSEEEVPMQLVTFFHGSRTEQEMSVCLDSYESQHPHVMGALFSQIFTRRYLPERFQHLLCRVNILLNIHSLYTTRVSDLRYCSLNSRQKTVLRERLTDARKNELNELLRTFREYKDRLAYSAEMKFLLNKVIRVLSDVLQDILYDNE